MTNIEIRNAIQQLLGSNAEPVAVSFSDAPPGRRGKNYFGRTRRMHVLETSCGWPRFLYDWRRSSELPIGAYTHGAPLTAEAERQLEGMIQKMVGIQYLRMEEVAGIPKRNKPLRFVVYAPLAKTPTVPDVVLLRGNARQMMLVVEAANARSLCPRFPLWAGQHAR